MSSQPIRFAVGRTNIRNIDLSAGAAAGRELNDAFTSMAKDFGWYVDQLEGFLPEDLKSALEPTFELSQEYVPVQTGDLKESGYLEVESFRNGARVEMGYGRNGIPDYAIHVHEDTFAQHAEPTRAKFLQAAVDEDYNNILQRVTDSLRMRTGA